ncbi:hypothetical protein LINPERPRIM_LOCUS1114 [Linum perenne]
MTKERSSEEMKSGRQQIRHKITTKSATEEEDDEDDDD